MTNDSFNTSKTTTHIQVLDLDDVEDRGKGLPHDHIGIGRQAGDDGRKDVVALALQHLHKRDSIYIQCIQMQF